MLKGIVIPIEWDENGCVTAVALSTHTEDSYVIERFGKGRDLFEYLQSEVAVNGVVRRVSGAKHLRVTDFRLTKAWD